MSKIAIESVPGKSVSFYPEPYASQMGRRTFQELGNAVGLTQFGVDLVTMYPGDTSSLRHWHSHEDEFLWVVSGELVLVQDEGAQVLRAGDAAGFALGDPNGHHLQNRSQAEAQYLVIGTRAKNDVCTYSDVDLKYHSNGGNGYFTRHDGSDVETRHKAAPPQTEGQE